MTRKKLNIIMFIITFILLCLIVICLVYMDDIRSALNGQSQSQTEDEHSWNNLPQSSSDTLTEMQETTLQPTFATVETTVAATVETTEATTVPTTEPETIPDSDPDIGNTVAEVVRQQVGKAYEYGGVGPDSFDTSGLVQYCYKQAGVSVPRSNKSLASFGYQVGKEEMRPGDAVFFWSKEPGVPEYLGIYVGDGMVVAALNSNKPIVEFNMNSAYYTEHFVFIRRFY